MTELKLSGKVIALIDVPEGVHSPTVTFYDHGKVKYWHVSYQYPDPNVSGGFALLYKMFGGKKNYPKKITVVGIASSLTEDMWKGIVECLNTFISDSGKRMDVYVDYEKDFECDTATESGLSLLAAHGKKPETCLIIVKNE